MDQKFHPFDLHRIFVGDEPGWFYLEIIFRTVVMYLYAVTLLRILGKRGMAQMSMLELAIIISFGSAVGDPMIGSDVPMLHGMTAITVVTVLQIGVERLINLNKKVEAIMEGTPNLVVDGGVIQWSCMKRDNLSKEDLFRALRSKDVEHLGQIQKAFFETTGQVSVLFNPPRKVPPGLSVLPESEIPEADILDGARPVGETAAYCCMECGHTRHVPAGDTPQQCPVCHHKRWVRAVH